MFPENRVRRGAGSLGWLLSLWAVAGCGGQPATPPGKEPARPDGTKTAVVRPERHSVCRVVEQPGTILPFEETQLYAGVRGYIGKVQADIGLKVHGPKYGSALQIVEPGQVLAEIDVPDLREEGKQKQALIVQARAEVDQTQKALVAAQAHIAAMSAAVLEAKANRARWESESIRIEGLVKRGLMDAQAGDETVNQFRATAARVLSAEAAVRKAQADADKVAADIRAAQARVLVAQAEAGRVEALLGYATIRAPSDGVVTSRKVNTGAFVQPAGGKGDWLFTVARLDPVRVVIDVPEADAGLVHDQAQVKLAIPALGLEELKGVVARTSWALQPGARTLRAEVDVPNKNGALRPGMYVFARIVNYCPETWTVPVAALVKQDDAMGCFFIEDGKAKRAAVQVGRGDGQWTEVLKYKAGSPPTWREFTGKETLAAKALGLTDGQIVP